MPWVTVLVVALSVVVYIEGRLDWFRFPSHVALLLRWEDDFELRVPLSISPLFL